MAIFIISARLGEQLPFEFPTTPYFSDVPANAFAFAQIQRMRQDQITSGCGPTTYCPNNSVTRGDMAIFIMRGLFNQLLAAGTPVIGNISPNVLSPGQQGTITITGVNTHFQQGISLVNPIPGVTFTVPIVSSATSLTVAVNVDAATPAQPWSIEVVTGSENAVLPSGLNIQ
jgi:hypothetical protein